VAYEQGLFRLARLDDDMVPPIIESYGAGSPDIKGLPLTPALLLQAQICILILYWKMKWRTPSSKFPRENGNK
jgi:hypothetical protein